MTQLYQRNPARHGLLARQGNGFGNSSGNGPVSGSSSSHAADSSTSSTPFSSDSPQSSSVPASAQSSTPSSVQSSSSAVKSSTTPLTTSSSTSASTSASKSNTPSTTISSSITSSTSQSTPSVLPQTAVSNSNSNIIQFTPTDSLNSGTQTIDNLPVSTTSAPPLTGGSSNLSAGNIVGAVAGTLIGLAVLFFLVVFILRRYRRSRRRALRDSDFGTFRRSIFASSQPTSATHSMHNMSETNIAPSLKEPYVPYSGTTAQLPSQVLAAATAANTAATPASGGGLQERPKYVYGQDPLPNSQQQQQQHDDAASETHGGAYSSHPQVQGAYDAEAYGSYAKYEDVGDGIVGCVPTGTAVYQDAQRAYQGQQGYDQSHYATYDPASYDQSQYRGYGQQPHHPQAYAMGSNHAESGGHVTFGAI